MTSDDLRLGSRILPMRQSAVNRADTGCAREVSFGSAMSPARNSHGNAGYSTATRLLTRCRHERSDIARQLRNSRRNVNSASSKRLAGRPTSIRAQVTRHRFTSLRTARTLASEPRFEPPIQNRRSEPVVQPHVQNLGSYRPGTRAQCASARIMASTPLVLRYEQNHAELLNLTEVTNSIPYSVA
jgi:hypothetical protein